MDAALTAGLVAPTAVALGAGVLAVAWRADRTRVRGLRALGAEQGWDTAARDDAWATALAGEPFGRGSARHAEQVLTGSWGGRDVVAFDYRFRTTATDGAGGTHTATHRFAVAVLRLPAGLPTVELVPRRLPVALRRGIELESEELTRRYLLTGDARTASDVLPARTIAWLLDRPAVSLRLSGECAVLWAPGRQSAVGLRERLTTATGVLDGVPSFVWADRVAAERP